MNSTNNISPEDFGRIENYLQGKMTMTGKADFEKEMNSNAILQREVAIQKELQISIEAGALKESLEEIHHQVIKEENKPSGRWWLAIAAGIAALIAVGVWVLNLPTNEQKLFAEYSTIDPGLPVPMSASSDYSFHDAMVDYKMGKYDKAYQKWSEQTKANPSNLTITYYLGSTLFNQEKYQEALPYFEKVMDNPSTRFRDKAQWYAVLSWLKTGNNTAIKKVIPNTNSPYSEKIISIQQRLK